MALHYNLTKVYAISDNDVDFAKQIVALFIEEVPNEIKNIKHGIKNKDYDRAYHAAHKIKPTLDLMGMDEAYEDVITIESWTKTKGRRKEVKEIFEHLKEAVKNTVKELKKDYSL